MAMDPVKDAARKILNALLESSMDGYRLQSKTNLSEQALRQAVERVLGRIWLGCIH